MGRCQHGLHVVPSLHCLPRAPAPLTARAAPDRSLGAFFGQHYAFVARQLRRFGVPDEELDDTLQDVFLLAAPKLCEIEPASDRAFLFSLVKRHAANVRRRVVRARDRASESSENLASVESCSADELLEKRRIRGVLEEILDTLADDLRTAFVLYEIEGWNMHEIATALELAPGTVASRLRRAREKFLVEAEKVKHRLEGLSGLEGEVRR